MELKDTLLMMNTGFEMRGNLAQKEPILVKKWQEEDLYALMNQNREGCEEFLAGHEDHLLSGIRS